MTMRLTVLRCTALCLLCAGLAQQSLGAANPPLIKHQTVTVAVQGQSLAMRATVTSDSPIKSVTLYYSTSKDVAPFKVQMQSAGAGLYVAAIPANLVSRSSQVTYYMEATDVGGLSSETPWYVVKIQTPQAGSAPAARTGSTVTEEEESFWQKPYVIGGGVLLVGGGLAAVLAGSGHSSDASPLTTTNAAAGTYVGSVTLSQEVTGESPSNSTHGMTITIDAAGGVDSKDLYEGQDLHGTLSESYAFTLTATITGTNLTGLIQYTGSVVGSSITGSAGGTFQTMPDGTNGVYYGSFNAVRQP
jgi:hypothetical protein